MSRIHIAASSAAIALATNVFAGTIGEFIPVFNPVITFSAGPAWSNTGFNQTFYITPDVKKSFIANKSYHILADGELFIGIQKQLNTTFAGQIGFAGGFAGNAKPHGEIWEDGDPELDNSLYNYKLNHGYVAIKAKLIADMDIIIQPYLSGSIGIGFNRAFNTHLLPKLHQDLTMSPFGNHNETGLTYTLGLGIQKILDEHWIGGLGYEFSDWGKNRLNRAFEQTLNTGLQLNHVFTNQIQLSVSYIF